MNFQLIDNFLEEEDFEEIKKMFFSNHFPWYFNDYKSYDKLLPGDEVLCSEMNNYQFVHNFYKDNEFKGTWKIDKLIKKIDPRSLIRIKANLTPRTETIQEYGYHVDFPYECYTAVYYVNSNDGYTIFEDGTMIESVENRILIFNSQEKHTGTSCTNAKVRVVINFNYF